MVVRRPLAGVLFAVLAACASTPNPREQALSGLEQKTRTIAVRIDESPPHYRDFQVHESQAGKGAGRGAAQGALGSLAGGAQTGEPLGLVLGIFLMPVFAVGGAVVGAVSAEPIVHHHPLDKVEEARPLFEATAERADLLALVKENLSARVSTSDGHKIRYLGPDEPADQEPGKPAEVRMWARITTYSLLGEIEEDPSVKLLVEGVTRVTAEWASGSYSCHWSYRSSSRRISDWSSNNGEKFVEEIQKASQKVASKILATLRPGSSNCIKQF